MNKISLYNLYIFKLMLKIICENWRYFTITK